MSNADVEVSDLPSPSAATVRIGHQAIRANRGEVSGAIVDIGGEAFYRIENVDRMPPFFATVVSAGELWMFASSTGALTAGRGQPERALFPYETVDKIHEAKERAGGKTLLLVARPDGASALWEPFSERYAGVYSIRRSLSKTLRGDKLRFEETNDDLGLTFSETWAMSERFGFVRTSELTSQGGASVRVLDGIQHVMPYGIPRALQDTRSVLADAYKQNEQLPSGLGVFALSAQPVDRAEPSEALKATTVWQAGLEPDAILLCSEQLNDFRLGRSIENETLIRARRGAYFIHAHLELAPGEARTWDLVADIEQDATDVVDLDCQLEDANALRNAVHGDVTAGSERLHRLVALADGEQQTECTLEGARHRMNVLFNVMRGGVFDEGYAVDTAALRAFVAQRNAPLALAQADWFDALPERMTLHEVSDAARKAPPHIQRLVGQYLPLHFSRRHGDPSRPWNHFSIDVRDAEGDLLHAYEGNWRDIFQNWEALGRSFPEYVGHMVTTFLSASTADGYNPYRITDQGIDWEVVEASDPWSYIGYWGDHQIIYLLRLLVVLRNHAPERLSALLHECQFAYANVPYRIKPYADILRDPQDTIVFDEHEAAQIDTRVAAIGADGKLLTDGSGDVLLVCLAEKLLVPLLSKLTNFVPGGGIWMNTQRPEWNDANNALVGNGLSVVTLFAVRRYLTFLHDLLSEVATVDLSPEIVDLVDRVTKALTSEALATRPLTGQERRKVVDALGEAGSAYRHRLYREGMGHSRRKVSGDRIRVLLSCALGAVDQSLRENRPDDGLVHSYNLLDIADDEMHISSLYPMLEGQVAALDSGVLSPTESLALFKALRQSTLYRPDQHSYLLYPNRQLPGFLQKNVVSPEALSSTPLLTDLLEAGNTRIVRRDARGAVHFNGTFRNKRDVEAALDALSGTRHADAAVRDRNRVLAAFEATFDHCSYTGRSGTFFGYEGLGSIYWHMVSKLALALQETYFRADAQSCDTKTLQELADAYYDVRAGLGSHKTPVEYGAFPADAYSHTPDHAGAKQPGMTGQVKEDILCRWGELGVRIEAGQIVLRPHLLRHSEFLSTTAPLEYVDVHGARTTLDVPTNALGFTYCATPVLYRRSDTSGVRIVWADGSVEEVEGMTLSPETSAEVFARTGRISRIEADVVPGRT